MNDQQLWQFLSSNSGGDICAFAARIMQCIHVNTGATMTLLYSPSKTSPQTDSHVFEAGKNVINQTFSEYWPQLSDEWQCFMRSISPSSRIQEGDPVLIKYDETTNNKVKKATLRDYFTNVLAHKLNLGPKAFRFPWKKIIEDPPRFILPGCLPPCFALKDPELLRLEAISELWKQIYRRQQSGRLHGLEFADEVSLLLSSIPNTEVSSRITTSEIRKTPDATMISAATSSEIENTSGRLGTNNMNCPSNLSMMVDNEQGTNIATVQEPDNIGDSESLAFQPDPLWTPQPSEEPDSLLVAPEIASNNAQNVATNEFIDGDGLESQPVIRPPSQVEDGREARLAYLRSLCNEHCWQVSLDVLDKIPNDSTTEFEAIGSPEWSTWQWDQLSLPASAFQGFDEPTSMMSWLSTNPHRSSPSYETAERLFLSLGLVIFNLSAEPADVSQWLNVVVALSHEIDTDERGPGSGDNRSNTTTSRSMMHFANDSANGTSSAKQKRKSFDATCSTSQTAKRARLQPSFSSPAASDGSAVSIAIELLNKTNSWTCGRCDRMFLTEEHITRHKEICTVTEVKFLHPPYSVKRDLETNRFTCPKNHFKSNDVSSIQRHIQKCYGHA